MIQTEQRQSFSDNLNLSDGELISLTQGSVAYVEKVSTFFERCPPRPVPNFNNDEYDVGSVLGTGEFGDVREISSFTISSGDSCICEACKRLSRQQEEQPQTRQLGTAKSSGMGSHTYNEKQYMKHHLSRTGQCRYAVKTLKAELTEGDDSEALQVAALDLALEAKFLASLSHPNIIKLRGTVGTVGSRGFAIVLDRLYLTLDQAIKTWKQTEVKRLAERFRLKVGMNLLKRSDSLTVSQCERLAALSDVARALRYLHANEIVYRDLKPLNIGQDIRGDFRMFDFGLAKELKSEDLAYKEGEYKMTGLVGTRRYMAPEVVLCRDYGKAVDVYSFGLLLWAVCSLMEPFGNASRSKHTANVVIKGHRPPTKCVSWLPDSLKSLMKQCWSADPKARPSMEVVCDSLRKELEVTTLACRWHPIDKSLVSWRGSLPEDG